MDMRIDYQDLYHSIAHVEGISVAGKSLMRSNFSSEYTFIPRGKAEDFGIFAGRRGLKVLEVNKHKA